MRSKTMMRSKRQAQQRRRWRVRNRVHGTSVKPRLTVAISNKQVSAQIIDDDRRHTLVSVTSLSNRSLKGNMSEKAVWVGQELARKAKAQKIVHVVFDRGAKIYHGRIKALADAARGNGLEF